MNSDFVIRDGMLLKYNGNEEIIKIPENIKTIGSKAFYQNKDVKKIILPNTTTDIGTQAFCECENLTEINLENVKKVYNLSFARTKIKNIKFNKVKEMGSYAFEDCKELENVEINNNVQFGFSVFSSCNSLIRINIPNNITTDDALIINCKNLEKINILGVYEKEIISDIIGYGNEKLTEVTGPNIICENSVVYDKNKIHLISYLPGKQDKIFKIPDKVKNINTFSFLNKNIEMLIFGDNIEKVEESAIECPNLSNIKINKNIKVIELYAFQIHKNIEIEMPGNVKINEYFLDYENCHNKLHEVRIRQTTKKESDSFKIIKNKHKNNILFLLEPTLEELLSEGKTFMEASQIIKNYER